MLRKGLYSAGVLFEDDDDDNENKGRKRKKAKVRQRGESTSQLITTSFSLVSSSFIQRSQSGIQINLAANVREEAEGLFKEHAENREGKEAKEKRFVIHSLYSRVKWEYK